MANDSATLHRLIIGGDFVALSEYMNFKTNNKRYFYDLKYYMSNLNKTSNNVERPGPPTTSDCWTGTGQQAGRLTGCL